MSYAKQLSLVVLVALFASGIAVEADELEPEKRLISTFQIVRFPNDPCTASTTRNGTCYTSAECSDKGGSSSGSCADGFGVCCQFVIDSCGSSSSENITYWDSPTTIPSGACSLSICPVNDNICQLRIDFSTFVITGPNTLTLSEARWFSGFIPGTGGVVTAAAGTATAASYATNCLADQFSVSAVSPSAKQNVICGTNTGQHLYVEADQNCNELVFTLSSGITTTTTDSDTAGVTALATRDWDMTIYQYECGYVNSAPVGCTQYQWGPTSGWITSHNMVSAGGAASTGLTKHLADQNQRVCIRRERGYCYACFYKNAANSEFSFAGASDTTNARSAPGAPCGHNCETGVGQGVADDACSYDCVIIPGLFAVAAATTGTLDVDPTAALVIGNTAAAHQLPVGPQISSGSIFGVGHTGVLTGTVLRAAADVIGSVVAITACTKHEPFTLIFKSDGKEGVGIAGDHLANTASTNNKNRGINLNYDLISCT